MKRSRSRSRPALRWTGLTAFVGLVAVVIWGCDQRSSADSVPLGLTGTGGWTFPATNPVIKAGDLRSQALWNDPSVLLVNGQYVMYMTTSVDAPFRPPILPFRAVSRDGLSWSLSPATPVVSQVGTPFVSVETPSVVQYHGKYHMFFTGVYGKPDPSPMAIGHAESNDGIQWRATPRAVISATGKASDWNGYLVGEPGAIVHNDQIYVYFSAVGARAGGNPPQLQTIGLAKTTDGTTFQPPVKVLQQTAVYPSEKGFVGYSTPAAFDLNGHIHLIYDVALFQRGGDPDWQQVALHHASSATGGETDFVQDAMPILTREDFPWTEGEILAPAILVDGATVKLWFAGHVRRAALGPMIRRGFAGPEFGIGYATRPAIGLK